MDARPISPLGQTITAIVVAAGLLHPTFQPKIEMQRQSSVVRQVSDHAEATQPGSFGLLPFSFEQNLGQVNYEVKFIARAPEFVMFLTRDGAVMASHSWASPSVGPGPLTTPASHLKRMGRRAPQLG